MAEPFQVNLSKAQGQNWGFRLQGGNDFSTALSIQMVNPGSIAEQYGLKAGDAVLQIANCASDDLSHEEAKRQILMAGDNLILILQRGAMKIWKPKVTPLSELRTDQPVHPGAAPEEQYVQRTSLAADKSQEGGPKINFYNRSARPFAGFGASQSGGDGSDHVPVVVNAQYNTPIGMYSTRNALDAFDHQSSSLVNQPSSGYSQQQSEPHNPGYSTDPAAGGIRSVRAPTGPPPNVKIQEAQHMTCKVCGSLIVGVFVKIKGEPMHAECYKCVRCKKSLKNQGYFTIEGSMHCDACAQAVSAPSGDNFAPQVVYR